LKVKGSLIFKIGGNGAGHQDQTGLSNLEGLGTITIPAPLIHLIYQNIDVFLNHRQTKPAPLIPKHTQYALTGLGATKVQRLVPQVSQQ
jgi:hypothetical protein